MVSLPSLASLAVFVILGFLMACTSSTGDVGSATSNLDTSGCSGLDASQTKGAVQVSAQRPPTASCWNIDESGLSVGYSWTQTKSATPANDGLSVWVALNGTSATVKAEPATCEATPSGGMGADTSGTTTYTCTAWSRVDFAHAPDVKAAAYGADGHRLAWDVQVAVALPDGSWDSLNGANYRFAF